ncbi:MAG: hypothetical protein AAFR50_05535 [Pseudomonadota bacterium]
MNAQSPLPGTTRPRHAAKKMTPGRLLCMGTHHKTGTVWMRKVLHRISAEQNIPLMSVYRARKLAQVPAEGPVILVNWSSTFPQELLLHPEARFLHVIRDPRDVLLSGLRYHLISGRGNEKFLRQKRDEWGGKSYQNYLKALPTRRDQLLFEMSQKHDETLREMLTWNYRHPHSVELNYEDLIEDVDCTLFRKSLEKIAVPGLDIDKAVEAYHAEALFGGKAAPENRDAHQNRHVSGEAGRTAQWVHDLPRDVAEIYLERYGAALKTLKYEKNTKWVAACREPEPEPEPTADDISFAG